MSQHYQAIRKALSAYFADGFSTTGIVWPNTVYTTSQGVPWVRFTLLFSGCERIVMTGDPETGREITGLVVIQTFTAPGKGDRTATALADEIATLLSEKAIPAETGKSIMTGVCEVIPIGNEGDWFQLSVQTPFQYET